MKKLILIVFMMILAIPTFGGISEDFYYGNFSKVNLELNNAISNAIKNHGSVASWNWEMNEAEIFDTYLKPYLSIKKTCEENDASCWAASSYMAMNGHAAEAPDGLHKAYILSDGTSLVFEARKSIDCLGKNDGKVKSCAFVWVDTTAEKFPNVMGRDYFKFYIHPNSDKILPVGYPHTKEPDIEQINKSCSSESTGNFCGAKLLIEKKMSY